MSKRERGRPPTGPKGERVSDYKPLTVRLPPATYKKLIAWSALTATPMWRLIDEALSANLKTVAPAKRQLIERAAAED